jgi:hypothetical protein
MMATCTTIQPAGGRSPAINMGVAHSTRGMRVQTGRRHSQLNRPIAVIPRCANLFEAQIYPKHEPSRDRSGTSKASLLNKNISASRLPQAAMPYASAVIVLTNASSISLEC